MTPAEKMGFVRLVMEFGSPLDRSDPVAKAVALACAVRDAPWPASMGHAQGAPTPAKTRGRRPKSRHNRGAAAPVPAP